MDKNLLKKIGIGILIVLFFLVLSYSFVPEVLSGKIVNQQDITGYIGMSHEMTEWNKAHPNDPANWTGSMFSGMPTTTISAPKQGDWTQPIYDFLLIGKRPATYIFISLLGAFLLMLAFGMNPFVAIGGAIAITFCSYNFQIIQVGHNTKMQAIAFLPWVLAAVVFAYRSAISGKKKWFLLTLLSATFFGLALSMQVKANHQQITYYLAILVLLYALVVFIWLLADKDRRSLIKNFFIASALLLVIGCVGIATNAIKLGPLYEYQEYSTRGGTELNKGDNSGKSDGLNLGYATAWSYGWEELPNLMIPNFNGGSSVGAVNPAKSKTYKLLKDNKIQNLREISQNLPLYWGPQPFTAGPMYMGAITIFLFILGLFLIKDRNKWWIVIATILAILMAVGNHFLVFTKLLFKIAPLYNKFRTVSMALVILQFTLPILAFMVLDKIVKGDYVKKEFMPKAWIAYALTAGFCLIFALLPDLAGTFSGAADSSQQEALVNALIEDRRSLFVQDALISFGLITIAFLLLFWVYSAKEDKDNTKRRFLAVGGICLLILVNMFAVGKRYLNSNDFITPRNFNSQFAQRTVDKLILEDENLSYRVLDLTIDMFNDSRSAYWHKEIAGYSPAKLQRYQDLIERYIGPEINSLMGALRGSQTITEVQEKMPYLPVMSMLNAKYFILGPDAAPAVNPNAFGNAWFVDSLAVATTPDEEIDLLGKIDAHKTAVIGSDYLPMLEGFECKKVTSPTDTLYMTSYSPNELHYHYNISEPRLAIFSEVFYPDGWHAWVDDESSPTNIFRTDWTLRGSVLPAGEHELVMRFDPKVYLVCSRISRISSIILVCLLLYFLYLFVGKIISKEDKN